MGNALTKRRSKPVREESHEDASTSSGSINAEALPPTFRIGMDGSIQAHSTPLDCSSRSRSRRPRRASIQFAPPDDDCLALDEDFYAHKSSSMSDLDTSRRIRRQRRCSITKYSLDITQSRPCHEEQESDNISSVRAAPPSSTEPLSSSSRRRVTRRCSVTKYSFDESLRSGGNSVDSEKAKGAFGNCPGSPIVATSESKKRFEAKISWGRAA